MRRVSLVLALLSAAVAYAQDAFPARRIGVAWTSHAPRISVSAVDLLDAAARRKLENGLPQTLLLRVHAYPENSQRPIAFSAISCRVVYDLWEEVFRVERVAPERSTTARVSSVDQVLQRCIVAAGLAVGAEADFASRSGSRVYFAVLAEFNTVSTETVQRVRHWLARRHGGLEGDAPFGSFVSLFVNRQIGQAERTIRFRSQLVTVP